MTQQELTTLNIGQSLDDLCNLDPRGYGVCRILYAASREYTGSPLTMNAAKQLMDTIHEGDLVYILTGFVLYPFNKPETDGVVSSVLLARSLVLAFHAKPVIICPEDCLKAVENLSFVAGLQCYRSIEDLLAYPIAMAAIPFTKDEHSAQSLAEEMILKGKPSAVVSIECPGANARGVYHNAVGHDVTELEAKTDILFNRLKEKGVPSIAIGDLGNEIGLGTIGKQLERFVPYAAPGKCTCPCKGGIAAKSSADHIITATVSDWGCYGMIAAIAFLKKDIHIMHDENMEKDALATAVKSGIIDMNGWLIPAIDGFGMEINVSIVTLMRECVENALKLENTCKTWFEKVIELGFYEKVE